MSAKPSDPSTPLAEITHGPSKFEEFLENNQKLLLLITVLIALGTVVFVVMRGVEKGKQEAAGASMIDAMNAAELEKIIDEHAGTQASKSAQLLLADKQWSLGERDAAIATLREFLADQADHPAAPTAKASLASKLVVEGRSDEAAALLEDLIDDPETRHLGAYALISLGDIAATADQQDKAMRCYERVIADYSDSDFVTTANSRIRDLGAVAPSVVDAPEPLEGEKTGNPTETQTGTPEPADSTLEGEVSLEPTKPPASDKPPVSELKDSPETETTKQE